MENTGTLLLKRHEVEQLLDIDECIAAVERAFKMHGDGTAVPPRILGLGVDNGGFHVKAGVLAQGRSYFAAKVNANFPRNRERFGLPTIQGVVILSDAGNGVPLAIMDSTEITAKRTGAATAVAARYLARADSTVLTICGCGKQGRIQLRSLLRVLPLKQVFVYDTDRRQAVMFADEFSKELSVEPIAHENLSASVRKSDVCVTCTPSTRYILNRADVPPGAFVAGVGADSEEKNELDPALFAESKIVVDVMGQCASIGDLHHAIKEGAIRQSDVHAELGEIVARRKPGRTSNEEIIIFDSTGMALQDVAAAALVYEKALAAGIGIRMEFLDK